MLVSVIVPTFNGERYVLEALDTVFAQTHSEIEIIVVDDGSTDHTRELVERIDDPRLRLIERANGGVAAARNSGIRSARGALVAFLDQDDGWFPTKLARQVPYFDDPRVAVVGSLMSYVGPSGKRLGIAGEIADHQQDRIATARLMPFAPSSMVIRTRVLRELGGFDEALAQQIAPVDDFDLVSRIARQHKVVTAPTVLGYYRIHADAGSFARFYAMKRASRYLRARLVEPGLAWEDWDTSAHDGFRVRRLERGRFLYRLAGLRIVSGQTAYGAATLGAAVMLAPSYSIRRLRRQLRPPGRSASLRSQASRAGVDDGAGRP